MWILFVIIFSHNCMGHPYHVETITKVDSFKDGYKCHLEEKKRNKSAEFAEQYICNYLEGEKG